MISIRFHTPPMVSVMKMYPINIKDVSRAKYISYTKMIFSVTDSSCLPQYQL
jgi:hypothetical protein